MTKKEFDKAQKPLTLIVSFHPVKNDVLYDYYDYDGTDYWLNTLKKDFPAYHTFMVINPAAIRERKKHLGLVEHTEKKDGLICDGCRVRGGHEHRCHGGNCNCDFKTCQLIQQGG